MHSLRFIFLCAQKANFHKKQTRLCRKKNTRRKRRNCTTKQNRQYLPLCAPCPTPTNGRVWNSQFCPDYCCKLAWTISLVLAAFHKIWNESPFSGVQRNRKIVKFHLSANIHEWRVLNASAKHTKYKSTYRSMCFSYDVVPGGWRRRSNVLYLYPSILLSGSDA